MNYTVGEIENGRAKITWSDDSFTYIEITTDMTADQFDDAVWRMIPPHLKSGNGAPSFLADGSRTASEAAVVDTDTREAWLIARENAYGDVASQIEYITENGITAWQTKVTQIKTDNPKPSE